MASQIYLPPIMFLLQLILSPSQEQQILVEYGPDTFISCTRGGNMMLKRWDDTTYNGTRTHTDKHTHTCTTKKQQDAIAVILDQEGRTHIFSQIPFFAGSRFLTSNPNK